MKTKQSHMPGPWKEVKEVGGKCWQVHVGNQPLAINNEANARLIAAAPELLEVLKKIKRWLVEEDRLTVEKAVAKAEGQEVTNAKSR